jgi:K(+)-stimulated pyrophosphate-energized sodium pump
LKEEQMENIALSPLTGSELNMIWIIWGIALVAIVYGFILMKEINAKDSGTAKMIEINNAIMEGANAYLARQFKTVALLVVVLAVVLYFTGTAADPAVNLGRAIAFVLGATASALTGFMGMRMAVKGNVRVAAASLKGKVEALTIAFRTGAIAGMFTIGLGLLGATTIFLIYKENLSEVLVGFGFGGCLLAMFMRVGGGIYTKAADVGADLVGKVEKNIPEDDPRNAATIADNVGDNVGDCAGMAADIFESYEVTLVASMVLGATVFGNMGVIFPLLLRAVGVITSIIGTYFVRAKNDNEPAMRPINRGFIVSSVLSIIGFAILTVMYVQGSIFNIMSTDAKWANVLAANPDANVILAWKLFGITTIGIFLSFAISAMTEYFTSTETKPVQEIAKATLTGPATTILSGTAEGMESSVWAILSIAVAIASSILVFAINPIGEGILIVEQTLYGVSLLGLGMLTITGIIVAEDTYGPISDNAQGVGEMAKLPEKARKVLDELDAVGNSTKAITKGFAIATAVIAAVSLFGSYKEITGMHYIDISSPMVLIGLLVGGAVPFLFSSLLIRAVGRAAFLVVNEVRRQFREIKGIMSGKAKPEYGKVVDICTTAALKELVGPGLIALLMPVIVGFLFKAEGLGGYLAGVIVVGQLLAVYLSNSGGAWDNAKKFIEQGNYGGKGSDAHRAAVIGDTVGDPFKDTAGPALNPLIKVMNLVAILIAPLIIKNPGYGPQVIIVVVICLAIIGTALFFSKRSDDSGIADEVAKTVSKGKKK